MTPTQELQGCDPIEECDNGSGVFMCIILNRGSFTDCVAKEFVQEFLDLGVSRNANFLLHLSFKLLTHNFADIIVYVW
jgi:hypothetical protein